MCTVGTYGFVMCATSDRPQAVKRPPDSAEPATWPRASAGSTPDTWLTFTPTFSNTAPRITRASPPPSRRCPGGLFQRRGAKRAAGSKASNAAHTRPCRSRKYSVARSANSLASLMHVIHEARHGVGVGVRPDAVAEVEDVAGTGAGLLEHRIDVAAQLERRRKERGRVEVALHGLAGAEQLAHLRQPRAPVDADDVDVEVDHRGHEGAAL